MMNIDFYVNSVKAGSRDGNIEGKIPGKTPEIPPREDDVGTGRNAEEARQ